MTHLYIELNTGLTEEVNSSIISKLYELAISGDLDSTSDLKGRLHSSVARDVLVTYLNEHFTDLHISADALYLSFVDPEVERILATKYGDGTGVTNINMAGVTEINSYTGFPSNTAITSFSELSNFNNIVRLGSWAFTGCTNLTTIDLTNILYIGGECFSSCNITGVVDLPNIIQIGDTARGRSFQYCGNITQINIGNSFNDSTTSMWGAFQGCFSLETITGLSNITTIPQYMFYMCNLLQNIDIDWSKITTIEQRAFEDCYDLDVTLDLSNISTLESQVFKNCKKLIISNFPRISVYEVLSFSYINNTSITIPKEVTQIKDGCFQDCRSLLTITFESNSQLTTIASSAFWRCFNLSSITIPEGTTSIGEHCFRECNKLTYVDIPSTITTVANAAFYEIGSESNYSNQTTVIFRGNTPPTCPSTDYNLFGRGNASRMSTLTIYVPDAALSTYKSQTYLSCCSDRIFGISQMPNS